MACRPSVFVFNDNYKVVASWSSKVISSEVGLPMNEMLQRWILFWTVSFLTHSPNCEKRLLASWCVCASVRTHWRTRLPPDGFSWNLIFGYFSTIYEKNQVALQSVKNIGYFYMKTNIHFLIISRSVLLRMRSVSARSCRGNPNTPFMSGIFFFLKIGQTTI